MRRGRVPEIGLLLLGYQLFQNIGLTNIPPVTCMAIIFQVAVYLQILVVPRICLSGESVWIKEEYLRLLVPAVRHSHDIHLYYNMLSLAWKGISLERRLGSLKFCFTLATLTLLSSCCYVVLAVLAADLLEDYSYMQQCAIGFSGVIFALKVLTTHYRSSQGEETSYFGFIVPAKYGVWFELVIIQILVPNTSFIGHLGGILAGVLFLKSPVGGVISFLPVSPLGLLTPPNPATLLLTGLAIGLHSGHLAGGWTFTGCVDTRSLTSRLWRRFSLPGLQALLLAPLHHLGTAHLVLNLFSLQVKSWVLEPRLGFLRYIFTVGLAIVGTTLVHLILSRLTQEVGGGSFWPTAGGVSACVVGLSGPLFALKVLAILGSNSWSLSLLYEVVELLVLYEKNTRLYHVSGLLAGALIYTWTSYSWPTGGRRLGGGGGGGGRDRGGGGSGAGPEYSDYQQPGWRPGTTRSWGYGAASSQLGTGQYGGAGQYGASPAGQYRDESGLSEFSDNSQDNEMEEAIRRSRQSYAAEQRQRVGGGPGLLPRGHTPSAPPLYPDLVGERPPLYPDNPGPPPPTGGVRLAQQQQYSRRLTADELRRHRLERFS